MLSLAPVEYLRATPPFDALPAPLFESVAGAIEVGFWPAGTRLVTAGEAPLAHLYLVRGGAVRISREGQTLLLLEEGEAFGITSLLTGEARLDVEVEEDLLAYRLPAAEFRRCLADGAFAAHFARGLAGRLESSLARSKVAASRPDPSERVEGLLRRPPEWVEPGATVGEAARVMRDRRVSSVLVRGAEPGIVTDRDLRNRVLAEGLGPATPVEAVASRPLKAVDAATPIHEAWAALVDGGIHHLPVVRGGEIAGVLTSNDVLKATARGPMAVLRRVERMTGPEHLPGYADKVAEMTASLLAGGLDPATIGGFVARLNALLVRRLAAWAEAELGPAPAPWAWLSLGSEGRMEQALLTDQDNALAWADEGEARRGWFVALAERVNDGLVAAGVPPCPGGAMARALHAPLSEWVRRYAAAIGEPRPQDVSLLFDFRRAAGALDLAPLEAVVARTGRSAMAMRALASAALRRGPPDSLRLRLGGQPARVDLKRDGIVPVVALARCYGLEAGGAERGTLDRLRAAAQAGIMGPEAHEAVAGAWRFMAGLRLRRQLADRAEGRPVAEVVELAQLTPAERGHLKEAFRAVRRWQEKAAYHYRAEFV